MAEINFLPVCSECGNVIRNTEINYEVNKNDYDIPNEISKLNHRIGYITPCACPHCGAFFLTITMPTTLPFKTWEAKDKK